MAKIIWSPESLDDIRLIHEYISRDSIYQANLFIDQVINKADRLADFSDLGRIIPELNDSDKREIIIGNYRLMYKISINEVWITGIIHGKRHFP